MTQNLVEWRAEFDRVWPWLWTTLCQYGCPTHGKEHVWRSLVTGKAFMWAGKACVIIGEVVHQPIGYRSFNYWLQGGDLNELRTLHPQIEDWAKQAGCAQVTGRGRDGWVRAMDGDWRKGPASRMKWLGEPPAVVRRALKHDPR